MMVGDCFSFVIITFHTFVHHETVLSYLNMSGIYNFMLTVKVDILHWTLVQLL